MRKLLFSGGVLVSALLAWFAVSNYQSARPLSEENLRGLALSLTAAIEKIALHDPSLLSLGTFQTRDIAYFAMVDRRGLVRFHTNPDLIGTNFAGWDHLKTIIDGETHYFRTVLGTGENAFEFDTPLNLPGETLALRLTLHTYRADAVVRRAELNMLALFFLLVAGWLLSLSLYRLALREEERKLAMAHRESLAQLGEMGATLAHEIRNPLAGIKGFAQVIGRKPTEERNADFAGRIVAETQRLEGLVDDLLAYARSDRGAMAPTDLAGIVVRSSDLLRQEAEPLGIQVVVAGEAALPVLGNRDRLTQVLLNLGRNAIQAMPDGGTLRLTAAVARRQAIVVVSDSGYGINQEDLPKIFEPFFTTKARGSGLGLAICKKIIEEHGGGIAVNSSPGEGTTVSVTIPLQ